MRLDRKINKLTVVPHTKVEVESILAYDLEPGEMVYDTYNRCYFLRLYVNESNGYKLLNLCTLAPASIIEIVGYKVTGTLTIEKGE